MASGQGGYFTSRQAASAGYDRKNLSYHHKVGNVERVGQGLYRLVDVPIEEDDDLMRVLLSVRDQQDRSVAVLSHVTAMSIHGMSDLFAEQIHLTVPKGFRGRIPPNCVTHRGRLAEDETEPWKVGRVTTPLKTLLDAGDDPAVTTEQLSVSVRDALDQGLVGRVV